MDILNKSKKCVAHNICQNGNEGCTTRDPNRCIRYLPLSGTNLTKISYIIETPPHIDWEMCSDMLTNWIDSMGWHICGIAEKYEEEGS